MSRSSVLFKINMKFYVKKKDKPRISLSLKSLFTTGKRLLAFGIQLNFNTAGKLIDSKFGKQSFFV